VSEPFVGMETRCRPKAKPQVDPLIELSQQVKKAYCQHRSRLEVLRGRLDGYRPPKRYNGQPATLERKAVPSVWMNLCLWAKEINIDILAYVKFQLGFIPPTGHLPEPLQLKNNTRVMKFRKEYSPDMYQEEIRSAIRIQLAQLRTAVVVKQRYDGRSSTVAHIEALTDSSLEVSPLVRYCVAYSLRKTDQAFRTICHRSFDKARKQLWGDKEEYLRSFFAPFIPAKLVGERDDG
jgi:hypothetical protein